MAAESPPPPPPAEPEHRRRWRGVGRQLLALAATLALLAVAAMALSTGAGAVQARRDEARSADLLIAVAPAVPADALTAHCFELYRRGHGRRVVVVGPGREGLLAALQARGLPAEALSAAAADGPETAQLRTVVRAARAAGATSAVVAGDGAEMLRWLKLAGDEALRAYGSPAPGEPGLLRQLGAGARYWGYTLLGR